MVNINKLKGKIVENGMTPAELAKRIGISTATMYRKMKLGGGDILVSEAYAIGKELSLNAEDMNAIFFAHAVSDMRQSGRSEAHKEGIA